MDNALMELPRCPTHKTPMHLRARFSHEQLFCGTWYDCDNSGCACSVLLPSRELQDALASMTKASV